MVPYGYEIVAIILERAVKKRKFDQTAPKNFCFAPELVLVVNLEI